MADEVALLREYEYYLSRKHELLPLFEGKFALIKGTELYGVFETDEEAYYAGLEKFGNVPFLVQPIEVEEEFVWLPLLELGLPDGGL